MAIRILVFLSFFFCTTAHSQDSDLLDLEPELALSDYFEDYRETIYLHLNKSTYIFGEEIWFKGYVYNRKEYLPSVKTANVYVEIFNSKNEEVYSGLFLANKGGVKGNIEIDPTWASDDYYIRATTNWMNNFPEDEGFTQKITILNEQGTNTLQSQPINYSLQLLAEGGHLVADTNNSVGFKLTNQNGQGVAFDQGFVVDELGNKIRSFSSNRFGIGKFNIRPKPNMVYKAVVMLKNGKEVTADFPQIEKTGVSMMINNILEQSLVIELNTNMESLEEIRGEELTLLIHKNDSIVKRTITFLLDQTQKEIFVKRELLQMGLNTITLFKGNMPILERLVFNHFDVPSTDIEVSYVNATRDSVLLTVKIPPKENITNDISISVLPRDTKAYTHNDNIFSAMMLKPYVKGHIENAKYYFTAVDRRKKYDLDLLLITQGWSKYKWKTIFDNKSTTNFDFNQGLTIKGKIQEARKENIKQLYIFPAKYHDLLMIDLDETKSFAINNFFPVKGDSITLSAINSKGSPVKTRAYIQVLSNRFKRPISASGKEILLANSDIADSETQEKMKVPKGFFDPDAELLEEVFLKKKLKKEDAETYFKNWNDNIITLEDERTYPTVAEYLDGKNTRFRVAVDPVFKTVRIYSRVAVSLVGSNEPAVYLDGVRLQNNFDILGTIPTSEIESVYMDPSGLGEGLRGAGGVIKITTKKGIRRSMYRDTWSDSNTFAKYIFKKGFEPEKEFYKPTYTNYLDPFFIDYGVIHWQPSLKFDQNGTAQLKIENTSLENMKFFIEGMRSDGTLLSKTKTLENLKIN